MKILFVEDDSILREELAEFLECECDHQVVQCTGGEEAYKRFQTEEFPLLLSDIRLPGMDGIELLKKIKAHDRGRFTDAILITGHGAIAVAIDALRAGAYDFLLKPFTKEELSAVVERATEHQALLRQNFELTHRFDSKVEEATRETESRLRDIQSAYANAVGLGGFGVYSDKMRAVLSLAEKLHADRSVLVLIEGETGTGKELVARLVHYGRGEVTTPFVSVNCSAITPSLFESELFGYEGRSFHRGQARRADRQAGAGSRRHAVSGRDRRPAAGYPAQAAAGAPGTGILPRGWTQENPGGRADCLRHQPRPGATDRKGSVSQGPVLPAQPGPDLSSPAARKAGGNCPAGRDVSGALCPAEAEPLQPLPSLGAHAAGAPRLARQRARAGERNRAPGAALR